MMAKAAGAAVGFCTEKLQKSTIAIYLWAGSLITQVFADAITAESAWTRMTLQQTPAPRRIPLADERNSIPSFIHRCGQNGIFQAICGAKLSTGVDFRTV